MLNRQFQKLLLTLICLAGFAGAANAAGPSPCYWSGTFVKCFPSGGLDISAIKNPTVTSADLSATTNTYRAASSTVTGSLSYEGSTTYSSSGLTFAGNSAGPSSYAVTFTRTGKQVTVNMVINGITMTNGQVLRFSGYSADYTPATSKWGLLPLILNATNNIAAVSADADGHIYIYKDANATAWTAVATNTGSVAVTFTYSVL